MAQDRPESFWNARDPFGGLGSTVIAAEQTDRRAFVIEIEMHYCGRVVHRWEKFTGRKAQFFAQPIRLCSRHCSKVRGK